MPGRRESQNTESAAPNRRRSRDRDLGKSYRENAVGCIAKSPEQETSQALKAVAPFQKQGIPGITRQQQMARAFELFIVNERRTVMGIDESGDGKAPGCCYLRPLLSRHRCRRSAHGEAPVKIPEEIDAPRCTSLVYTSPHWELRSKFGAV